MTTPQPDYRTPRWVKLLGAAVVILIVLFVLMHALGGGMAGLHQWAAGTTAP